MIDIKVILALFRILKLSSKATIRLSGIFSLASVIILKHVVIEKMMTKIHINLRFLKQNLN